MMSLFATSGMTGTYVGSAIIGLVLLSVLFLPKIPRTARVVLTVVLAYAMIEVAFLRNPWFWRACNNHLAFEDVGWKQKDMIKAEVIRRDDPWHARYLAVGSSQVWAIFREVPETLPDLRIFNLAGMSPVETYLYRDIVARHCDDTVILYLSDLDLARPNLVEGFKLAPPRDLRDLAKVTRIILDGGEASWSDIAELWISNRLSLYRYQFIFRGILKLLTNETKVFRAVDSTAIPSEDEVRAQIEDMSRLTDKWFDANIRAVDQFLAWCQEQDLNVVVVEGDYHPAARRRNHQLRIEAHALLEEVCRRHPNTRFFSNEVLGTFALEDYMDGAHVYREAGRRFAERLIHRLDTDGVHVGLPSKNRDGE